MSIRALAICFAAALIQTVSVQTVSAQSAPAPVYYPGEQWRTATPESQGIDSQALAAAIDQIRDKQLGVHSLLVIRHGYVVSTTDFYPYNSASPHDLASVTKT